MFDLRVRISPSVSYSVRRLALFAGTLIFLSAVLRGASPIVVLAAAAIVSGILSYFLLAGPRSAMAGSLASRLSRLNARLDSGAAAEDAALEDAERRARRPDSPASE
ncbi:MAG: DUF4229 domain-containing protein [Sporichthyaceae bacterium]